MEVLVIAAGRPMSYGSSWGGTVLARLETAAVWRRGINTIIPGGLLGLRDLTRRVAATILAKVDLESAVILLTPDSFDGLDSVCDVGEIDECAALLSESIDKLNLTIFGEVLSQPLLAPGLVQVSNVDVSGSSTANG